MQLMRPNFKVLFELYPPFAELELQMSPGEQVSDFKGFTDAVYDAIRLTAKQTGCMSLSANPP
jgi:hypothetical protein